MLMVGTGEVVSSGVKEKQLGVFLDSLKDRQNVVEVN